MNIHVILVALFLLFNSPNLFAFEEYNEEIEMQDGSKRFKIGIKILIPDEPRGPRRHYNTYDSFPVYFYVHGGGWNGKEGDSHFIPPATVSQEARFLCDRLGIVYVGLTYRVKENNATFSKAIIDLEKSVEWFKDQVTTNTNGIYDKVDLSRIGFGGGSAGSTLASVMALKSSDCKLFIGHEGMYDITTVDQRPFDNSNFPDEESRKDFGLATRERQKAASAFQILKERDATGNSKLPPPSLLIHGESDWLCDIRQSTRFANLIRSFNVTATVVRHPKINHISINTGYPDSYKRSALAIAKHFNIAFNLEPEVTEDYMQDIDDQIETFLSKNFRNKSVFDLNTLYGIWKDQRGEFKFLQNFRAIRTNNKGREFEYDFKVIQNKLILTPDYRNSTLGDVKTFYMRENKTIYQFITEENISQQNLRYIHRAYDFKQTESTLSNPNVSRKDPIKLHPNPALDKLFLSNSNNTTVYSIYDLSGKTIINQGQTKNGVINIQKLKSGLYFIYLKDQNIHLKFIKS